MTSFMEFMLTDIRAGHKAVWVSSIARSNPADPQRQRNSKSRGWPQRLARWLAHWVDESWARKMTLSISNDRCPGMVPLNKH